MNRENNLPLSCSPRGKDCGSMSAKLNGEGVALEEKCAHIKSCHVQWCAPYNHSEISAMPQRKERACRESVSMFYGGIEEKFRQRIATFSGEQDIE